jgi:BolA protein
MVSMSENIHQKLQQAFTPTHLEVIDQSHLHKGHAGARSGGESHFAVTIKAYAFNELSLLARHRAINKILAEELKGAIHALNIKAEGV